ncbi:MAG TPA: hypothetical protein VFS97_05300 [Nitrososphaeraceae archaeon]|nr:hypothetical protein [Nitrososphaeraceae archaeon]
MNVNLAAVVMVLITSVSYASAQSFQNNGDSVLTQLPGADPSLGPMPDLNFSNSPESGSSLGIASPEFNLPDVNGTYVNSEVGLQIELPNSWTGKEISFLMNSVIASPQGVDIEAYEEPGTVMIIQMINQEAFNQLANLAQSFGFGAANESQMRSDPLAIGSVEGEQCDEVPASFVTINRIKAEQRSASCTNEEGTTSKIRAYAFATANDTIILMALSSNSTSEYNQYLPLFDESVKTIKISEPGDITTSELYRKHKEMERQRNMTLS